MAESPAKSVINGRPIGIAFLFATWFVLVLGCQPEAVVPQSDAPSAGKQSASADSETKPLMVYGKVPPFQLTDQFGEVFHSDTLTGKVYLATFFFTTCPTTCPQQSQELSGLQNIEDLSMLSITVQPNVDTPEVLHRYSQQYNANLSKWHFLTGTRAEIWNLSQKGFFLPVGDAPQPSEMPIFHSSKIILVDRQQQIRGFYESQLRSEMVTLRSRCTTAISGIVRAHGCSATLKRMKTRTYRNCKIKLQGAFLGTGQNAETK